MKTKIMLALLMVCVAAGAQGTDSKVNKKVRSCEKRNWPVDDSVCHGYALAMAHEYYVEHPDFFAAPKPPVTQPDLSINGAGPITYGQISGGSLNITYPETPALICDKYQHVEASYVSMDGDQMTYHPSRCVDDIHMVTEKEWQELTERLKTFWYIGQGLTTNVSTGGAK